MTHELEKLDQFLGLPIGTTFKTLVQHSDPRILNEKLKFHGIILDEYGMVPKSYKGQWKQLMIRAGIPKKYWKDPELLLECVEIENLAQ